MPTVRNARGADLYAASADEKIVLPIQSKALSKKKSVPLGASLENLRSPWWVITVNANSASPTCYVLTLEEVKTAAYEGKTGAASYWLETKSYMREEFKEQWGRLGDPRATTAPENSN
jgi:hypothetical protein